MALTFPSSSSTTAPQPAGRRRSRHDPRSEADRERARRTAPRATHAGSDPATDMRVWTLHVRYERTGAAADLEALVEEYRGYAVAIARRLHRRGEPREDLEQVALESLVVALQRFSVERGIPFAAFATPTITGAVKRHYRDRGWVIRAPRQTHDLAGPIRGAREDLTAALGRPPTAAEVADVVGVTSAVVADVDGAVRARAVASLDSPVQPDGLSLGDTVGHDDPAVDLTTDRVALAAAMEVLSDRDREILTLYFVDELSQRDIARRYGVSQMQVSRWLRLILGRLRARMVVSA